MARTRTRKNSRINKATERDKWGRRRQLLLGKDGGVLRRARESGPESTNISFLIKAVGNNFCCSVLLRDSAVEKSAYIFCPTVRSLSLLFSL